MIEAVEATDAVVREFRLGYQARAAMAAVAQERVNGASRAIESRLMEGIGQLRYRVDADFYWMAREKFGQECWSDKAFLRDCVKRGALHEVRGRSEKTMIHLGSNIPIKGPVKERIKVV